MRNLDGKNGSPERANIVTQLPDGRFVVGMALPIYTREDLAAFVKAAQDQLDKLPTATSVPLLVKKD